jgi:hydroxyethylthiazole kinase-like uncharacterized protein yjeF
MIELLTNAEMAEADRLTIASGVAGITLMENAGRAVADTVAARSPPETHVAVVAGPGNNGGDGFVAARCLADRGYPVRVLLVGDPVRLKGDAARAADRFRGDTEQASPDKLAGAGIVIDALFGAGLDRPVDGLPLAMIEAINGCGAPVVAVDLPSGINGTSGSVMGAAVMARESVTFFRMKPGHLLLPGRLHCGEVRVADIGIRGDVLERIGARTGLAKTWLNRPALWRQVFPVPRVDGHKYSRGHAVVMSGPMWQTGAARLAARAALRAGAGLVTIASPRDALAVNAATNLAVMVRPVDGAAELAEFLTDPRLNAAVLGPGGGVGAEMRDLVAAALAGNRAVVLDADALTSFADNPAALFSAIAARPAAPTILTPHEGEFARIFGARAATASKLDRARMAAQASRAVVLIKGPDTVVAAPDGRAAIADNASPWLATAGSGDVLAGMIAGLAAQRMSAFEATCAAVWLHGEAGTLAGPGLIAEDLPDVLPRVLGSMIRDQ